MKLFKEEKESLGRKRIMINFENLEWNMESALLEAEAAYKNDEVPIGAVIVDKTGKTLSSAHNVKEASFNPCGHAEILAIQEASKKVKNWRLNGSTLFVTLEPCPMCLSAALQARIERIIFGAYDLKGGAISLGYNLFKDRRLNHNCEVIGGVQHYKCSSLLSTFFREKRKFHS